jgi:hypothetical protein
MRTIEVRRAAPLPTYTTAAEAVRADLESPRRMQSEIDSDSVAGALIEGYCIEDDGMWLNLSNDRCLAITVGGDDRPTWDLTKPRSGISERNAGPKPMRLIWKLSGKTSEWEPMTLLEGRLRCPLRSLFGGESYLNLYFDHGGALRFDQLINLTEGLPLLFFSELEAVERQSGGFDG